MRSPVFTLAAAALALLGARTLSAQSTVDNRLDRSSMDTTCAACSDFFDFANGGWLRTAKIPASKTSLGSFSALTDSNQAVVHRILDDDAAAVRAGSAKPGTNEWKVGTFYESCMDTVAIAARGIEPIRPLLDSITRIGSTADLIRVFGESERRNGLAPFSVGPAADPKNSNETIVSASQGGLGLPDRDYYLRTDARSENLRKEYVAHVAKMLQLVGEPEAQAT